MNDLSDLELFTQFQSGNEKAFETLFKRYYPGLCVFADQYLKDRQRTESLVQEMFTRLWEKRGEIVIQSAVKSYLFRMLKNQVLNWLEHEKVEQNYRRQLQHDVQSASLEQFLPEVGLMQKIEAVIAALPPRRQEIFRLSRQEGLSYQEIAERLSVSVKTVENQMGAALKQLRAELKNYRHLLIGFGLFEKYWE